MLGRFGVNNLIVREVAAGAARESWGLVHGLLRWTHRGVVIVSTGVALAAAALAWALGGYFTPLALTTFFVAVMQLPLISLATIRRSALRGLREVVLGQVPEQLIRPLLFIATVAAAYWLLDRELSPPLLMGMRVVIGVVVLAAATVILWRRLPPQVEQAAPVFEPRLWLASAVPFAIVNGMQTLNVQADVLILGALSSSEQVGIYVAAAKLAQVVVLVFTAVEFAISPYIAGLYASGETPRLQRIVTRTTRVVFGVSLPVALVFVFFGSPLLSIFGEEFRQGSSALTILAVGRLLALGFGPVGAIAIMTGQERPVAWIVGSAAALNIVLNLVLVPYWASAGAAAATAITVLTWNASLFVLVKRRTGIVSFVLGQRR